MGAESSSCQTGSLSDNKGNVLYWHAPHLCMSLSVVLTTFPTPSTVTHHAKSLLSASFV